MLALSKAVLKRDSVGCLRVLGQSVVQTPNFGKRLNENQAQPMSDTWRRRHGVDRTLRVRMNQPGTSSQPSGEVSLAVWIIDPKATRSDQPNTSAHTTDHAPEPRGTILLLHGYRDGPAWMLRQARALTKAGYRAVVISMRGHAQSTGDYHTFGVREKQDVSQVIDTLQARHLIRGKLGIWGISYGSTTSLETAAIDSRIQAVVAMAGFSSMRGVTPHYLRVLAPFLALVTSEAYLQRVVSEAGRIAGFDPDDASAQRAVGQIQAPVLLIHGKRDWLVPVHHAHTLYASSNAQTTLTLVPRVGHIALILDVGGRFSRHALTWFDQHLLSAQPQPADPSPQQSSVPEAEPAPAPDVP